MASKKSKVSAPRFAGAEVTMHALDAVAPNPWNPNYMTDAMLRSLKHGLLSDGWLLSHALLIWRTDEKGMVHNLIIDGEHRWTAAQAVGFDEGPMVFLDKLTQAQAQALTVKLMTKRGQAANNELADLLREIDTDDRGAMALDLGFEADALVKLLDDAEPTPAPAPKSRPSNPPKAQGLSTEGVASLSFSLTTQERETVLAGLETVRGDDTLSQALVKLCERLIEEHTPRKGARKR